MFSTETNQLRSETKSLVQLLQRGGWVLSNKSQVEPVPLTTWVGKEIDGLALTIKNLPSSVASTLALWLQLASTGYKRRSLQRLLGKLMWTTRPRVAAMPFLEGSYAWLIFGPETSKYTPPAILRSLAHAISTFVRPWRAPTPPDPSVRARHPFVDAAPCGPAFMIGKVDERGQYTIKAASRERKNQHAAELHSIERVVKQAARNREHHTAIIGDNLATLRQTARGKARIRALVQQRILRRIHHCTRWSGVQAHLAWVASEHNPADPVARAMEHRGMQDIHAHVRQIWGRLQQTPTANPVPIGVARHWA